MPASSRRSRTINDPPSTHPAAGAPRETPRVLLIRHQSPDCLANVECAPCYELPVTRVVYDSWPLSFLSFPLGQPNVNHSNGGTYFQAVPLLLLYYCPVGGLNKRVS